MRFLFQHLLLGYNFFFYILWIHFPHEALHKSNNLLLFMISLLATSKLYLKFNTTETCQETKYKKPEHLPTNFWYVTLVYTLQCFLVEIQLCQCFKVWTALDANSWLNLENFLHPLKFSCIFHHPICIHIHIVYMISAIFFSKHVKSPHGS